MEFVPGGELFDFIVSNGRLSEPRARIMFQQLISGVEHRSWCRVPPTLSEDTGPMPCARLVATEAQALLQNPQRRLSSFDARRSLGGPPLLRPR